MRDTWKKGDETVVTTAAENGALLFMLGGSPTAAVDNAAIWPLLTEDWTARATTRLASVGVMPAGRVMPSACTTSGGVTVCAVAVAVTIVAAASIRTTMNMRVVVTSPILFIPSSHFNVG